MRSDAGAATGEFDAAIADRLMLRVLCLAEQVIGDRRRPLRRYRISSRKCCSLSFRGGRQGKYILYRDQHARFGKPPQRRISTLCSVSAQHDGPSMKTATWLTPCRGSQLYFLGVSAQLGLKFIYPPEDRQITCGDFLIHDYVSAVGLLCGLGSAGTAHEGFRGCPARRPAHAKHLRCALGPVRQLFRYLRERLRERRRFRISTHCLRPLSGLTASRTAT